MAIIIRDFSRKSARVLHTDGLIDLAGGLTALMVGAAQFVQAWIQNAMFRAASYPPDWRAAETWQHRALWVGMVATLVISFSNPYVFMPLAKRVRQKYVYPRIGYFTPRVEKPSILWWKSRLGIGLTGVGIIILLNSMLLSINHPDIIHDPKPISWFEINGFTMIEGIFVGLVFVLEYFKFRFRRHLFVAASIIVASILFPLRFTQLANNYAQVAIILAAGMSLTLAGFLAFLKLFRLPVLSETDAQPE